MDLPTDKDRIDIFSVLLKRYNRDASKFNLKALAKASTGFTGAEIEQIIIATMFRCFADGQRDITDKELLAEVGVTTPQSRTNAADLTRMRSEAQGRLRMASDDGTVAEVTEELRSIAI